MQEKLLILKTSPIKSGSSLSEQASILFTKTYQKNNKNVIIEHIDLNNDTKLRQVMTSENLSTFFTDGTSNKWIAKLQEYDKLVISTSMINGAPAPLLHSLINRITIIKKTFKMVLDQKIGKLVPKGIFKNKPLQIIFTKGGNSSPKVRDEIINQINIPFKFLGFKSKCLLIEGTDMGEKKGKLASEKLTYYQDEIKKSATSFY